MVLAGGFVALHDNDGALGDERGEGPESGQDRQKYRPGGADHKRDFHNRFSFLVLDDELPGVPLAHEALDRLDDVFAGNLQLFDEFVVGHFIFYSFLGRVSV